MEAHKNKSSSVVLYGFIPKDILGRQIVGMVEVERFLKFPKVYFEPIIK